MREIIGALYVTLTLFSFGGFIVALFGWMGDHNNRYPLPLMFTALVSGCLGQLLLSP